MKKPLQLLMACLLALLLCALLFLNFSPLAAARKSPFYDADSAYIGEAGVHQYTLVFFEEEEVFRTIYVEKRLFTWHLTSFTTYADKGDSGVHTLVNNTFNDTGEPLFYFALLTTDPAVDRLCFWYTNRLEDVAGEPSVCADASPSGISVVDLEAQRTPFPYVGIATDQSGQPLYFYQPGTVSHSVIDPKELYRWHPWDEAQH